jgi:peptide/nickel transport system permease protein
VAALWLAGVAAAAALAPWLPLEDPATMDLARIATPPASDHRLGTDGLGRDLLSRAVHGGRASLFVGLLAPIPGLLLGAGLGLAAAYFRGPFDRVVVVTMDMLLAFPGLVFALAVVAFLGPSLGHVTLALGVLGIPAFARMARADALAPSRSDYIQAARASGAGHAGTLLRHVIPNVLPSLVVFTLLMIGIFIAAEGALSFLGLGVPQPKPSWGGMIAEGRNHLGERPHVSLVPAGCLFATVLAFNVLGEKLRARRRS